MKLFLQVQESNFKLGEMLKELNQLRMKETDRQDSLALAVEDRDLRIDNLLGIYVINCAKKLYNYWYVLT